MKRVYSNKKVVYFNADKVNEVSAEEGLTRVQPLMVERCSYLTPQQWL